MKDHNWHRGGYGKLTVTEILGVSSNVGTSSIIENFTEATRRSLWTD